MGAVSDLDLLLLQLGLQRSRHRSRGSAAGGRAPHRPRRSAPRCPASIRSSSSSTPTVRTVHSLRAAVVRPISGCWRRRPPRRSLRPPTPPAEPSARSPSTRRPASAPYGPSAGLRPRPSRPPPAESATRRPDPPTRRPQPVACSASCSAAASSSRAAARRPAPPVPLDRFASAPDPPAARRSPAPVGRDSAVWTGRRCRPELERAEPAVADRLAQRRRVAPRRRARDRPGPPAASELPPGGRPRWRCSPRPRPARPPAGSGRRRRGAAAVDSRRRSAPSRFAWALRSAVPISSNSARSSGAARASRLTSQADRVGLRS